MTDLSLFSVVAGSPEPIYRQLVAQVRRCAKCGAYPDATDQYCIFCGETLTPQLTSA